MNSAIVMILGVTLPLWGSSRAQLEAQGFRVRIEEPGGVSMWKREKLASLGPMLVHALLFEDKMDMVAIETERPPEQLATSLKAETYCSVDAEKYSCKPKAGGIPPFAARVCGNTVFLWLDSDPEAARQVSMGCSLAENAFRRGQQTKREAGTP
jgi:hypothetical protein